VHAGLLIIHGMPTDHPAADLPGPPAAPASPASADDARTGAVLALPWQQPYDAAGMLHFFETHQVTGMDIMLPDPIFPGAGG